MYTSNFWDAESRSGAFFFLKMLKKFAKVFQQFLTKTLTFGRFKTGKSSWASPNCMNFQLSLPKVTQISSWSSELTQFSGWASHFRWAARPKIEKFLFPNSAKRRVFLTQKTRRSAIPRPIFASVHGPLRRVYTSRLRMRFPQCIAVFLLLTLVCWYLWIKKLLHGHGYYFENATQCGKRMRKPDVATGL